MKKVLLSTALLSAVLSQSYAQHLALHELFTGENCGPCATHNPNVWGLSDANPTKILNITFMTPIPSTGAFYKSQETMNAARRTYYNVNSAPHGKFDGNADFSGFPTASNFTQSHIDARALYVSPFAITATHYFNATNDTVFGTVKIKATAATTSTLYKLRAAFTKTIHFASAPGSNGEKHYPNVVRAMFTATTATNGHLGQAIKTNWAIGDSVVYTYKGKIGKIDSALSVTNPFTKIDSNLVVWIQNDTTAGTNARMIFSAAKSTYKVPTPANVSSVSSAISDIAIFPNPATNFINVRCSFITPTDAKITITSVTGQRIVERQFAAGNGQFSENLSLGNISNGTYQLSITANNETVTKQFIVNK